MTRARPIVLTFGLAAAPPAGAGRARRFQEKKLDLEDAERRYRETR